MNVVARKTLQEFWERHRAAEQPLLHWYQIAKNADWKTPNEVKELFPSADHIGDDRTIFNIKGNHFRLIVRISYVFKAIQIKWIGTHAEYDKIDALTV